MTGDGDVHFLPSLIRAAESESLSPTSRVALARIPPAVFLSLAEPLDRESEDKTRGVALLLAVGRAFTELPRLEIESDGTPVYRTVGHEGRHRALVLQRRGVRSIPCLLVCRASVHSPAIRWSDPTCSVPWPEAVRGQPANHDNVVPFDYLMDRWLG